jgi:SNF2 family DNA or RNA helicase
VVERVRALMQGPTYLALRGVAHNNLVRRMTGFMGSDGVYSMSPVNYQSARLVIHASPEFVRSSFHSPTIEHAQLICATPHNIRVLNDHISPDMLERLNAGDVKGALESLGMNAHSEEEITKAVTESLYKDLDHAQKTLAYKQSIEYSTEAVKAKALETCQQKIASIQSRISAIEERIKKAGSENCPICYCDISGAAVVPCCQQVFCFACLCTSLSRAATCPLCRARIEDVKTVKVLGERNAVVLPPIVEEKPVEKPLSKKDAFVKFAKANRTAKILMFSSYDATFGAMERELREADVAFATLNGSNARISKLLKDFSEGKYTVLFLNARNMGAGLNIESATHVVLYHKMNSELENQIIGRAVRLGRTADLDVLHLLHENETGGRISHV